MRRRIFDVLVLGMFLSVASYAQVGGPGTVIVGGGSSGGSGDVVGPANATDNAIVRFDATTGKLVQSSNLTCSDVSGVTTTLSTITPAATTGATVAGQSLAITASPAVASTDTAGAAAGGSVTITAGAAARNTSGNANGGDINLVTGAGIGTGVAGSLVLPAVLRAEATAKDITFDMSNAADGEWFTIRREDIPARYFRIAPSGTSVNVPVIESSSDLWINAGSSGTSTLHLNAGQIIIRNGVASDTGLGRNAAGVLKVTDGSTGIRGLLGGGAAVASATAMPVPTGIVFHVTGTTNITSITSTNLQSGVCVTLIFDGVLTFTDGSNLKLAGNFVTTADDTISLCYDGTNFYETARSVN